MFSSSLKRSFDVAVAAAGLVILGGPMLTIAALVRLKLGAPVLFRHQRPGLHGKPFWLVKFRTMKDLRGSDGHLLDDSQRLTSFGQFLRARSLDELPELWNVLKGDMSLVGPRPLKMHYLELYSPRQARRHDVRPGITGWAQVHGRNTLSWEERFELDLWYVENSSFLLDLRILGLTISTVLNQRLVSAEGHATMPDFTGSGRP